MKDHRKLTEDDVVESEIEEGAKRSESGENAIRVPRCTEFASDASVGRGFRSSYRPADRFGCLWSSHASHVLLKG